MENQWADLTSSILVHGLLQNLTVVEQSDTRGKNTGKYAVIAGGRRFAALTKLAKDKAIPKTFGIRAFETLISSIRGATWRDRSFPRSIL